MAEQGEYRIFAHRIAERRAALGGKPVARKKAQFVSGGDYCLLGPGLSARQTFTRLQLVVLTSLLALILAGLFRAPESTVIVISLLFSLFYLAVVLFRAAVLADFDAQNLRRADIDAPPAPGKTYIILAALYDEADQVPGLINALERLDWRSGGKRVFLICEACDQPTITAIRKRHLPPGFELVIVPDGSPRTKPRALNHVLGHVDGDYLVIYDAEDRPDPNQLVEAARAFETGQADLACLQAPLNIDNAQESWLTRMFAIEYDTLFLGILPSLTHWRAPMPLGGTSNHFKMRELKRVGGWDSYNVTEDADLGIRLARFRLRCGVISAPTHEEAPACFDPWLRQRTRWIKGWMQTLLVHMRSPLATMREMGPAAFFKFHMVLTSVVASVLVHPFFLIAFAVQMVRYFSGAALETHDIWITGISVFNLVAGYLTYGFLALAVERVKPKGQSGFWMLLLPVYWLLISLAGWRALVKIVTEPHHWEKTPHVSDRRTTATLPSQSSGPTI